MNLLLRNLAWISIALVTMSNISVDDGQAPQNPALARYRMTTSDSGRLRRLSHFVEIGHRDGDTYEVFVPHPERERFLAEMPDAELVENDLKDSWRRLSAEDRAGFHTFDSVQDELRKLTFEYPGLASMETYGKSMEGRPLISFRISTGARSDRKKPVLVITSATHGNEITGVEVVMTAINRLLQRYYTDDRIGAMLDTHEIYFLPVINPDGYVRKERYANGIDPNRDYPYPNNPGKQPNPCIQGAINFFTAKEPAGSIDIHTAAGVVMYPWAYTYQSLPQADRADFEKLVKTMAKSNGYHTGPIANVMYIAEGSSADYYYWKLKTKATAIELSQEGSSSLIPKMVDENWESLLSFIEYFK